MPVPPTRTILARDLRNNMTRVEWWLWSRLRFRQLDGWKFRRQAPIGDYIVDFVCLSARLVVEIDGPDHEYREAQDARRDAWLESEGFHVIRFTATQVFEHMDDVVAEIWAELATERLHPAALAVRAGPTSPPSGEGTKGN